MKIAWSPYIIPDIFRLFILLFLFFLGNIEALFTVYFLGFFFLVGNKVSVRLIYFIFPLLFIVLLGILRFNPFKYELVDFIRDLVYFTKPLFAIVFGFILFKGVSDTKRIFRIIILLGFIFSVIHVSSVLLSAKLFENSINAIRAEFGLNNFVELLALLILLVSKINNQKIFGKKLTNLVLLSLILSFILYFSRTMIVGFVVMMLFSLGYHRLSAKNFIFLILIFVFIIIGYLQLLTMDLSISATGIEGFLYKLRMAPGELFFDSTRDTTNLRYLFDHWRGFESYKALSQMRGFDWFFGTGFGRLVDLGDQYMLGGDYMREIPHLHNGFIFVLFKTGFLGLLSYIAFFIYFFKHFNTLTESENLNNLTSIMLSFGVFYFLSSFVVTGVYNQGDILTVILGGLFSIYQKVKNQLIVI